MSNVFFPKLKEYSLNKCFIKAKRGGADYFIHKQTVYEVLESGYMPLSISLEEFIDGEFPNDLLKEANKIINE